jgi:hypothetical protein
MTKVTNIADYLCPFCFGTYDNSLDKCPDCNSRIVADERYLTQMPFVLKLIRRKERMQEVLRRNFLQNCTCYHGHINEPSDLACKQCKIDITRYDDRCMGQKTERDSFRAKRVPTFLGCLGIWIACIVFATMFGSNFIFLGRIGLFVVGTLSCVYGVMLCVDNILSHLVLSCLAFGYSFFFFKGGSIISKMLSVAPNSPLLTTAFHYAGWICIVIGVLYLMAGFILFSGQTTKKNLQEKYMHNIADIDRLIEIIIKGCLNKPTEVPK